MKLLKFGTRYTKVGGIRLGIPDLVPAKPNDPGPLYVRASEAVDKKIATLALMYLTEYREHVGFKRDACFHPGVVVLQDKADNLDALIERFKKEIAT